MRKGCPVNFIEIIMNRFVLGGVRTKGRGKGIRSRTYVDFHNDRDVITAMGFA